MNDTGESPEAKPAKRGEVWIRRDGNDTAVFDPESGRLYALNASALAIWELCDGATTPQEMAGAISELTGLSEEAAAAEVARTLESLLEQGLISVGGADS